MPEPTNHGGLVDWATLTEYRPGDIVRCPVPLPRWRIWWERLRLLKWDVETTELVSYWKVGDHAADSK